MANWFDIGDIRVLVVSDGYARVPGPTYFLGTTAEQWEPHKRWQDHDGNIEFSFSSFVIHTGGKRILIDTGLGPVNFGPFSGGALLSELAAQGIKPEDIDVVFVTHLHFDHCGLVVTADGDGYRPAFPRATYRWTSAEQDFWVHGNPTQPWPRDLLPPPARIHETIADRFDLADGGAAIAPGVNVVALPGHTPGHAGVILSSGDERAFILGDAVACPVQLEEPEWSGMGDMDPKLARHTQESVLREIEDGEALLGAAHFPGLTFGRVLRGEGKRYWEAV